MGNQRKSRDLQNREDNFDRFFQRQRKSMTKDISLCKTCKLKKTCTGKNNGKGIKIIA